MDRGSQITVISTECAKKCSLPMKDSEPILLSTFGNKVSRRVLKRATVNFYKEFDEFSGNLSVNAFVMDKLVDPIKSFNLSTRQKEYLKNNDFSLADEKAGIDGELKIDMLLGQDVVHHFCNGKSVFMPGGSVLIPTWGNKYLLAGPLDGEKNVEKIFNFSLQIF